MEQHEIIDHALEKKYCHKHMYWFPISEGCATCNKLAKAGCDMPNTSVIHNAGSSNTRTGYNKEESN